MPKSEYDEIALEYYDSKHITSRNFDAATAFALEKRPFKFEDGLVLEIGAGRGRATEFLGLREQQLVQLDASASMLELQPREACLLRILADACNIPLPSQQFSAVVGFLIDPFIGLNSLAEAYRMLTNEGKLLFTVPTYIWGTALRRAIGIDVMTTRFKVIGTEKVVMLPSILHPKDRINQMMLRAGFRNIEIDDVCLPSSIDHISSDIEASSRALGLRTLELPIIHVVRASR